MKAPLFWQKPSLLGSLLDPLGRIYSQIVQSRLKHSARYASSLPVICVGNVVMGGSGKTPVVQALAKLLTEAGQRPAILMRGYGGMESGPLLVNQDQHDAKRVGDEALLHATYAPVIVARDRVNGAQLAEGQRQFTHILLDDGLQNSSLKKDLSLVVLDGENPFGNGHIFPAGPLRETLDSAIRRVQALVILGEDRHHLALRYGFVCPVFPATLTTSNAEQFANRAVIAFAGIGRPEKFFHSLHEAGAVVIERYAFADHYMYHPREMNRLVERGQKIGAQLVTTRKDWVRLTPEFQAQVQVLDVTLAWQDEEAVRAFLKAKKLI